MSETADPAQVIVEALETSPVYVHPQYSAAVTAEDVADLEAAIGDSPVPIYVVLAPLESGDLFGGSPRQLMAIVHDRLGVDGHYVTVEQYGGDTVSLSTESYGSGLGQWRAARVADEEPELADKLDRFVELVVSGDAEEAYAELESRQEQEEGVAVPPPLAGDGDGGLGGGTITLLVVLVLAVIVLGTRLWRGRAGRLDQRRAAEAFAVPTHVLEASRRAQADAVRVEADRRILALGTALEGTTVPADAGRSAEYASALDAYDAAGRTRDRASDLTDLVGALVLAETGEAHLRRATGPVRALRSPRPRPCFLDPLHGAAVRTSALHTAGRTAAVQVPVCADCAADLRAHRAPQPLVVTIRGTDVPYYESGREPWASTGYGALRDDLVEQVLTGRPASR